MALTPGLRLAIGKRAGLTSGVLGMLCVLAELCFLLPDLLVTKEALPMYAANLDLFRALLGTSTAATIALGALGVALSRPNRRGLLGIALAAVALLMGGPEAQPLDVGVPRAFSVGLDYFVLELLVLALLFVPIEGLWPLRAQ
jgi:predicted cobalt transporter CbtA